MIEQFNEQGNWVLPVTGTLGNKAKNLLENRVAIDTNGFKTPRSLVIPHEYLRQASDPLTFVLGQIDNWFPDWRRIMVRSNSPDEDFKQRFPGLYKSEDIWFKDRDYALGLIGGVIRSYDLPVARLRRKQLGLEEQGMCLLVQEAITNSQFGFDPKRAGCFSDIGELAHLYFTNVDARLESMKKPPIAKYDVDSTGQVVGDSNEDVRGLASKLRKLTNSLPPIKNKGWEIEFVENKDGIYVVQTTPITKQGKIVIPSSGKNIFRAIDAVGTGEYVTDGILYVPNFFENYPVDKLAAFDTKHTNYCIVTDHFNIGTKRTLTILDLVLNPRAIVDVTEGFWYGHPFAPHILQYMREGRIALAGEFNSASVPNILMTEVISDIETQRKIGLQYSPTKLVVRADEASERGSIQLLGKKFQDFKPL